MPSEKRMKAVSGEANAATVQRERINAVIRRKLPATTGIDGHGIAIDDIPVQLPVIAQHHVEGAGVIGDEIAGEGAVGHFYICGAFLIDINQNTVACLQYRIISDEDIRSGLVSGRRRPPGNLDCGSGSRGNGGRINFQEIGLTHETVRSVDYINSAVLTDHMAAFKHIAVV